LLHRRRPSYQLLALDIYRGWCLYPDPGAPAIAGQDDYPDAAVYENRLSLAAIENQHCHNLFIKVGGVMRQPSFTNYNSPNINGTPKSGNVADILQVT
jgi:hypothetical protein